MGSGAGDATKPSKSLIRAMVAALTFGPVQARGWMKGEARVVVRRKGRVRVGKYIGIINVEFVRLLVRLK